jgi:two-component sensor histidine kinase
LEGGPGAYGLSVTQITTLALVVNELMTNAIKHAFQEDKSGHIRVSIVERAVATPSWSLTMALPCHVKAMVGSAWELRSD